MLKSQNKNQVVTNGLIELGDTTTDETYGKGRRFVSRFIEAGVAHYQELGDVLITKETLNKFISSIIGCPVIIQHKEITDKNADKERVGIISRTWFNEADGWFYCEGVIWNKQAIDLVKNQGWSVSCTYDFVSDFKEKTHNGKKIDMEFTGGNFLHLALVPNPRYERANIVINSKDEETQKVNNGWITTDRINEDGERIKIWIPENVHWTPPKERSRVLDICKGHKQGDETKFNFDHTRVKPTQEQINYLKDTLNEIKSNYKFKDVAQIEISSSLNSGSLGVCFAPNNASLISLSPQLYNGKYTQKRYDEGVKKGWNPRGTGEMVKSVLVHELGHSITCNSNDNEFWNKIAKVKIDYMKNITKDDIDNPDFISNYARTNRYEFVAEAFCQGTLSKKYGKYTRQVMDIIKEHFSTNYQTKIAMNESDDEVSNNEMWVEGFGFGYPKDEEEYKKFKQETETLQKKEKNQAKNSIENRKGLTMAVLEELKDFIKGVVENAIEKEDKRKLIDEIGGILKGKIDEELWRTVVGKIEKIAYEKSETGTADNKCKNEDEEMKKEKFKEEKEIADVENKYDKDEKDDKKSVENSMGDLKQAINGGNGSTEFKSDYLSQAERLKLGENY